MSGGAGTEPNADIAVLSGIWCGVNGWNGRNERNGPMQRSDPSRNEDGGRLADGWIRTPNRTGSSRISFGDRAFLSSLAANGGGNVESRGKSPNEQ